MVFTMSRPTTYYPCHKCGGTGKVVVAEYRNRWGVVEERKYENCSCVSRPTISDTRESCSMCNGYGEVDYRHDRETGEHRGGSRCPRCGGTGKE